MPMRETSVVFLQRMLYPSFKRYDRQPRECDDQTRKGVFFFTQAPRRCYFTPFEQHLVESVNLIFQLGTGCCILPWAYKSPLFKWQLVPWALPSGRGVRVRCHLHLASPRCDDRTYPLQLLHVVTVLQRLQMRP